MDEAEGVSHRLTLVVQLKAPTLKGSDNGLGEAHAGVRQRATSAGIVSVLLLYLCPLHGLEECYSTQTHPTASIYIFCIAFRIFYIYVPNNSACSFCLPSPSFPHFGYCHAGLGCICFRTKPLVPPPPAAMMDTYYF